MAHPGWCTRVRVVRRVQASGFGMSSCPQFPNEPGRARTHPKSRKARLSGDLNFRRRACTVRVALCIRLCMCDLLDSAFASRVAHLNRRSRGSRIAGCTSSMPLAAFGIALIVALRERRATWWVGSIVRVSIGVSKSWWHASVAQWRINHEGTTAKVGIPRQA